MNYCFKCANPLQPQQSDGVKRLMCTNDDCGYIHWDNPVPVVAALVQHEGDYIIARNAAWPAGLFSVITGYLEKGETPEQSVLREVGEELGLTGEITRFLGHYSFFRKNQLILGYEIQAAGELKTNHELADVKRLSAAELKDYDFRPLTVTQRLINDWLKYQ